MVMLVWWILSLLGVCSFTWLPVLIDLAVSVVYILCTSNGDYYKDTLGSALLGAVVFAVCKQFLALDCSGWWILLSPVWLVAAMFIPGGFTITNLLLKKFAIMSVPVWVIVVGIICDVTSLIFVIYEFAPSKKK